MSISPEQVDFMDGREHDGHLAVTLKNTNPLLDACVCVCVVTAMLFYCSGERTAPRFMCVCAYLCRLDQLRGSGFVVTSRDSNLQQQHTDQLNRCSEQKHCTRFNQRSNRRAHIITSEGCFHLGGSLPRGLEHDSRGSQSTRLFMFQNMPELWRRPTEFVCITHAAETNVFNQPHCIFRLKV